MGLGIFLVWNILQSNFVGSFISEKATKILSEKKIFESIKFEKAIFNVFPPGLKLLDIEASIKKDELEVNFVLNELEFIINPFELFKSVNEIDQIILKDGAIRAFYKLTSKNENETKIDLEEILKKAPILIEEIKLQSISYKDEEQSFFINELSFYINNGLSLKGFVENIELPKFPMAKIDTIMLEATYRSNVFDIKNIEIKKELISFKTNGSIKIDNDFKNIKTDALHFELSAPLESVHDFINFSKVGRLEYGNVKLKGDLVGQLDKYKVNLNLGVYNFCTSFLCAKELNIISEINNENIQIVSTQIETQDGSLWIKKPFEFYNFKKKKFIEDTVQASLISFSLNDALTYLGPNLEILKGKVTGDVDFILNEEDFHFSLKKNTKIEQLSLVTDSLEILKIPSLTLNFAHFNIYPKLFKMSFSGAGEGTELNIDGEIEDEKLWFKTKNSLINLDRIEKIAGIKVGGRGEISVDVKGNGNETTMELETKFQDFSFLDLNFQRQNSNLIFKFNDGKIIIDEFLGYYQKSKINLFGSIDYKNNFLDLKADTKRLHYTEFAKVFDLFMNNLEGVSHNIDGKLAFDAHLYGGFSLGQLNLNGKFTGLDIIAYGEPIDRIDSSLNLSNGELFFTDLKINKGKGNIKGTLNLNLMKNTYDWDLALSNLLTTDIATLDYAPLELKSIINGSSTGTYDKNLSTNTLIKFDKTTVLNKPFYDSKIVAKLEKNSGTMSVNLFENKIVLNLGIEEKNSNYYFKNKLMVKSNIKEMLSILSGIDNTISPVNGFIDLEIASEFKNTDIEHGSLQVELKKLNLNRKDVFLDYESQDPEIKVENGIIKKWKFNIEGSKFSIKSNGEGALSDGYKISGKNEISSEILEVFPDFISKSTGSLSFEYLFDNKNYEASLKGQELAMNSSKIPIPIKRCDFKIDLKKYTLFVNNFDLKFPVGEALLRGNVQFNKIFPDINLWLKLNDVSVPIMKRASASIDGQLRVNGKKPPYLASGDFKISKAEILTELSDIDGSQNFSKEEYPYLPKTSDIEENNLINFNIGVSTLNPIRVNNSLSKLSLMADIKVLGGEKKLKLDGKIQTAGLERKIFFKGNEFNVIKGNLNFYSNEELSNPEVDFLATSIINDYKINVEAFGKIKDLNVRVASDPGLPQEDILSLVAFGYTDETSNNLSVTDKENMTKVGVGALIFDSLKINETLKNEFGLKVNFGTEITQEEKSYLAGRTDSSNSTNRVKTSTKVEVNKQLTDAMNLSVSSTLGGNSSQKQSMNLNYNITNKISVEGVYEMNTKNEGEEDNIDNSMGADLKVRWNFK